MANQQQGQSKKLVQETRVPLIGAMTNRSEDPTKDQRFINIFPETRKVDAIESTRIFLNKRPGLLFYKTFGSSGVGRGLQWFRNKLYCVVGNQVFEEGTPPTSVLTMTTSTGPVGMYIGDSSTLGVYLFICDGTDGWVIKSDGSVVKIDSTQIQSITIATAGSGYTNGTYSCSFSGGGGAGAAATYTVSGNVVTSIVITNKGTGYTSVPTVGFPSGGGSNATATVTLNTFPSPHIPVVSFIDGYLLLAKGSDIYNCVLDDPLSWKSGEYITAEMFPDSIVAVGRQNNQVIGFGEKSIEFFYDAANVAGSPLNRTESTILQMGCAFPYAIYQNENSFIFVGQSDSGGRAIWKVDGFTPKKVSDEYIDRILDKETSPLSVRGFGVRTMGHLFYVINLPTLNRTLVYDTEEKLWHEWSNWNSNQHNIFACSYMADPSLGYAYVASSTSGDVFKLDTNTYQDNSSQITTELITNRYDMDTYKRKFASNVRVVGDRYISTSVDLRWTDDDYQTWSSYMNVSLSDEFPNFARLGSFRRRAFNIKHTDNTPLRLECLELTYAVGDS